MQRFLLGVGYRLVVARWFSVLGWQPVEVLGGATHLALAHQFDQARFRQLGDVVVGIAEGDLQLAAEIAGGEDAAAVDAEDF